MGMSVRPLYPGKRSLSPRTVAATDSEPTHKVKDVVRPTRVPLPTGVRYYEALSLDTPTEQSPDKLFKQIGLDSNRSDWMVDGRQVELDGRNNGPEETGKKLFHTMTGLRDLQRVGDDHVIHYFHQGVAAPVVGALLNDNLIFKDEGRHVFCSQSIGQDRFIGLSQKPGSLYPLDSTLEGDGEPTCLYTVCVYDAEGTVHESAHFRVQFSDKSGAFSGGEAQAFLNDMMAASDALSVDDDYRLLQDAKTTLRSFRDVQSQMKKLMESPNHLVSQTMSSLTTQHAALLEKCDRIRQLMGVSNDSGVEQLLDHDEGFGVDSWLDSDMTKSAQSRLKMVDQLKGDPGYLKLQATLKNMMKR